MPPDVISKSQLNDDESLKKFSTIPELETLNIGQSLMSGEGLKYLRNTKISNLYAEACPITDKGMKEIAKVRGLNCLFLHNCNLLTPRELSCLSESPGLEVLNYSGANFTEDSIAVLKDCPRLINIQPCKMTITEVGADHLLALKEMKTVYFYDCDVTLEAWKKLQSRRFVQVGFSGGSMGANELEACLRVPARMHVFHNRAFTVPEFKLMKASPTARWTNVTVCGYTVPDRKVTDTD